MNILMIGNGFDLYHDLPTAYINFIHFLNQYHKRYSEAIPMSLAHILRDEELKNCDNNLKTAFEIYGGVYEDIDITQEEHKKLVSLKNNYWLRFFQSCCPYPLTWIDFEKEILNVITAFDGFFKSVTWSNEKDLCFTFDELISNHFILSRFNFFYVRGNIDALEDDGSLIGYKYIRSEFKVQNPIGSNIFVINKEKIVDFLYEQLEELSNGLKLYLQLLVKRLFDSDAYKDLVPKYDMFNGFNAIINFNYTNTFEIMYQGDEKIHNSHIHGDLENNIILGVNSSEYDEIAKLDTTFLKFKKYFQRVFFETDFDFLKIKDMVIHNKEVFKNRYKDSLTVFGHSLDKTDEDIITSIFEVVDDITIYCYDRDAMSKTMNNLISIYGRIGFENIRYFKTLKFILIND